MMCLSPNGRDGGATTLTSDSMPLTSATVTFGSDPGDLTAGWNTAPVSEVFVEPGLYVVSVNVVSDYSVSSLYDIAPAATPSVLTLVAGSYTNTDPSVSKFPNVVQYGSPYPTNYFWLDVFFTPIY